MSDASSSTWPKTVYAKSLNPADKLRPVSALVVTASGTNPTVADRPDIWHWWLVAQLASSKDHAESEQEVSVTLDMIPANPPTGTMVVKSDGPALSKDVSLAQPETETDFTFLIPTIISPPPNLNDLIALILSKGLDRYEFDDTGSGCVHWVVSVLELVEETKWIEEGVTKKFVEQYYRTPYHRGTFY
ncbi:hypothetical protein EIP86_008862 [Pleurotus ostreatoroseus]|nr:hypothetical protein EIP86_008862 [Pleurotus ostreatoroseus]